MNEIDLLARIGGDVPPLSDTARRRVHDMLLARAAAADTATTPHASRAPRRRLRVLALAGTAAAATAAIAVPLSLGSPAYAVDRLSDGTVTVRIHEFLEPKKLQASLREAGVPAEVDYLPAGQACRQPRGVQAATAQLAVDQPADGGLAFRIPAGQVKAGQTLVLVATFADDDPSKAGTIAMSVVEGRAARCTAVPAPAGDGAVKVVPNRPGDARPGTPAGS
ncbi:hypothetical protein [Sphaerisporangium rubeum]|uniref:Uncharacterized protein n=1 Tax=Sphaerisporangium rubeum TaxID=321317 RepID=A0A7X0ID00_9ACTN|nr:hypothetical protein [Sphaerisporangium rubeum]MBB6472876.1 hypothetical protein [Sphaerisporangium rubeum]